MSLRGFSPLPSSANHPPQRRAFAESGAATAVSLYDPSRENSVWSAPQSLSGQSPSICLRRPLCRLKAPLGLSLLRKRGRSKREIINNSSAIDVQQRRRPPPAAETGRSCWGSGQQDASAAQGTKRMLGAATRKQRSTLKIVSPSGLSGLPLESVLE